MDRADNKAMRTSLFVVLLLFIMPFISAQETNPASTTTQPQSGTTGTSGSDIGAANPAGGGIGSNAVNSAPAHVRGGVTAPKAIQTPDPDYPEAARNANYQGTVVLWLIVDTDGTTKQIKVVRKLGMGLDEEAVAAVKKWRFRPATKNGLPVAVQINVEVNFRTGMSEPDLPLHSPAQMNGTAPQFPGADLKKYPLVIYNSDVVPLPKGTRYQVRATASFDSGSNSQGKPSLLICESNRNHCSLLWSGYYPARWIVEKSATRGHRAEGN